MNRVLPYLKSQLYPCNIYLKLPVYAVSNWKAFGWVAKVPIAGFGRGMDATRACLAGGLSQNGIHWLEHGSGSRDKWGILLDFYHNKGYNVQWAIAADHSKKSMYREEKVMRLFTP
jgi:hypothetical protein